METGYENVLLVRLLLEMRVSSIRKSSVGNLNEYFLYELFLEHVRADLLCVSIWGEVLLKCSMKVDVPDDMGFWCARLQRDSP